MKSKLLEKKDYTLALFTTPTKQHDDLSQLILIIYQLQAIWKHHQMTLVHGVYDTMPKCWVFGCNISTLFFSIYLFYGRASELVLRASSSIPASYLTCGSSIIQVMLASFKYLLEHKVLKIFSFIYNSSSNNCLPYVFIQEIIIDKSKKLKKNGQF